MYGSSATARKALSKIACNRLQKELLEWQVNPPSGFKHKVTNNLQRCIVSLSRTLISRASFTPSSTTTTTSSFLSSSLFVKTDPRFVSGGRQSPWIRTALNHFHSLTDTRFPKRRPVDKPHRKRASLRPSGPYAWVQYTPGKPISPNNPNEGSVKRRNEKKRMRLRCAFIKSEAKKRKAQLQEANRKKRIKRVERKMAAVARERAWAVRLAELQQLEEEKKKSTA